MISGAEKIAADCARRSPASAPLDAGSIPAISTRSRVTCVRGRRERASPSSFLRGFASRGGGFATRTPALRWVGAEVVVDGANGRRPLRFCAASPRGAGASPPAPPFYGGWGLRCVGGANGRRPLRFCEASPRGAGASPPAPPFPRWVGAEGVWRARRGVVRPAVARFLHPHPSPVGRGSTGVVRLVVASLRGPYSMRRGELARTKPQIISPSTTPV